MHVSSISQNLSSGRWSTSALRQTWSQTASRQQLRQSRGQLWERCFDIVNITNLPRRLWKLSLHQFSLFPSAGGVGGNPREQNEEKMSWCSTRTRDLLNFHPVNVCMFFCKLLHIHAKSGRLRRYISANFFGFSAKFQAENAKSILHPSHRLRQHHLRWRQHHLRWRQHYFRWKQHHFLLIFTIFCQFSPFFIDFHDLRIFVAFYILSRFTHFFRNIARFLHFTKPMIDFNVQKAVQIYNYLLRCTFCRINDVPMCFVTL